MKNLFDYAKKELSQDAFLSWVFDNYDDKEVGKVSYALLRTFCNLSETERIKTLTVEPQWRKIDLTVRFETDSGRNIVLYIEDKIDSGEHSQLENYNKYTVEKEKEVYKVYFKPGYIYSDEIERVEKAGWKVFDLNEIAELFKTFESSGNLIVKQYCEHMQSRFKALGNVGKPEKNDGSLDYIRWLSYFNKTVIPNLRDLESRGVRFEARKWQYPYVSLLARYQGQEGIPYLEIRSRDCTGKNFNALIVCFGMGKKFIPKQQALIERIRNSDVFESKYFRSPKKDKDGFPKQIGRTKKEFTAETNEQFVESVRICVSSYLDLMEDWDK